ncbi:MAG: phosphoglycerate dehydrogenase [Candidatus Helarchaeota archaeon]|nr:phosphoglycerate dehydrogenase [Candidatus Helarchaeota archaeon]
MPWKVLIPEKLDSSAITLLKRDAEFEPVILEAPNAETLKKTIETCDALIVRSKTQVNEELLEAGKNLKVIGRAGVGTDNIDLISAEKKGILVVNAPEESLDSVADLTIGLIIASCRKLHLAFQRTREGNFFRKDLLGCELRGLTLGIVGYGRIGQKVAQRAKAFKLTVIAFDPYINPKIPESDGVKLVSFNNILASADIISFHLPLNENTRHLISNPEFKRMKKGAFLINTSRAEIIDTSALISALDEGVLSSVALDVVAEENSDNPLIKYPNVIISPHIGASTFGAQKNVGLIIVREIMNVLQGKPSRYPVNFPKLPSEAKELYIPYRDLLSKMASILLPLTTTSFNKITIGYPKNLPNPLISILTRTFLSIYLKSVVSTEINIINSQKIAEDRAIEIVESILSDKKYYNTVNVKISMSKEVVNTISGQITAGQRLMITKINNYDIKFELTGNLFLIDFMDRPGMIGSITSFLGKNSINIAELQVARLLKMKTQLMALKTDESVTPEITRKLQQLNDINWVHYYSF